jgi:thiol-disulfide isomerase/thioredoxin
VDTDPKQAEQQLNELRDFANALEPKTDEGKQAAEQAKSYVEQVAFMLKLAQTTLEQLETALKEKPGDAETLRLYQTKAANELYSMAMYQPDEAQGKIDAVLQSLQEQADATSDEEAKSRLQTVRDGLARQLERVLEQGRELAKTLGQTAAPLEVEAWVNGEPLTNDDLKGKVVLLDFWAVWCGPCIATFPHLREWNEKYADKGLTIIGLTNYYNYAWDDEAKRASQSGEQLTAEQEHEMLTKFAEHHELKHRFAVQKKDDNTLSAFYQVNGIPHVVLLDRESKVRLYRIGSGEQNAKDVEAMIEKLLAEGGGE